MDAVFKALNDPSRRRLLDELFTRDGRSLAELCAYLPDMTRFGVMNHLAVLEAGGLITTRKAGRHKLHYLNPVPSDWSTIGGSASTPSRRWAAWPASRLT